MVEEGAALGDRSQTHAGEIGHGRNGLLVGGDHAAMPVVRDLQDEATDAAAHQLISELLSRVVSVIVPRRHQQADPGGAAQRLDEPNRRCPGRRWEIGERSEVAVALSKENEPI